VSTCLLNLKIPSGSFLGLTAELLKLIDLELYPTQKMLELTSLEKQLVEFLKAVFFNFIKNGGV
ncbi:MAG: hypothetical protein A8274_367, partial [Halanaerobium sp. 4-GBenrich]